MKSALILICLMLVAPAYGGTVTIDPNAFSPGQNVSAAIPGVQLQTITMVPNPHSTSVSDAYAPLYTDVFVQRVDPTCCGTPLGTNVFGYTATSTTSGSQILWGEANFAVECLHGCETSIATAGVQDPVLRVNFTNPTDFLSMMTSQNEDTGAIYGFSSAGQLLGRCFGAGSQSTPGWTCGATLVSGAWYRYSVTTSTPDISYAIVGGLGNVKPIAELQLDSASTPVPLPPPVWLLLIGFVGVFVVRRSHKPDIRDVNRPHPAVRISWRGGVCAVGYSMSIA